MAGQLMHVCKFAAKSFRDGSFNADTYKAISQEQYSVRTLLLVHVLLRFCMALCTFSVHRMCVAAVCYGVYDVLNFLLERRMNRTLRPHEDALLDFSTSLLVREAFGDKSVLLASAGSGFVTLGVNGGLRLWAYFHRGAELSAKPSLA